MTLYTLSITIIAIIVGIVYFMKSTKEITIDRSKTSKIIKIDLSKIKKNKIKNEASTNIVWILNTGITLILISGVIFATTNWENLSDIFKVLFLMMFAIVIFITGYICDKVKVKVTGRALWVLGTIYVPIVLSTICRDGLLGSFLSIEGEGKFLYGLISSAICIPIFIATIKKYKSTIYTYVTYVAITLATIFLFKTFNMSNVMVLSLLSIINLVIYINSGKYKLPKTLKIYSQILSYITCVGIIDIIFEEEATLGIFIGIIGLIPSAIQFYIIDNNKTYNALAFLVTLFAINYKTIEILNLKIEAEIGMYIIYILEYLIYIILSNIYKIKEEFKGAYIAGLSLMLIVISRYICEDENYIFSAISLATLIPVALRERKIINKITKIKLAENIVPYIAFACAVILRNVIEVEEDYDLECIITSVIYILACITIYLTSYILGKKQIDLSKALREGSSNLFIFVALISIGSTNKYAALSIFPLIVSAAITFLETARAKEGTFKRALRLNTTYFLILNVLMSIFLTLKMDCIDEISMIVMLAIVLICTYLSKGNKVKQNIFAIVVLILMLIVNLFNIEFIIGMCYLITSLISAKMLYNCPENKKYLLPIITTNIMLALSTIQEIIVEILELSINETLEETVILTVAILNAIAIIYATYTNIKVNKNDKNGKLSIFACLAGYEMVMIILNYKIYSLVDLESLSMVMITHSLILFGYIYSKYTGNKKFNYIGQIVCYSLLALCTLGSNKALDFIIPITFAIILSIIGNTIKDNVILRGSLIALVVMTLIAAQTIILSIPWWIYVLLIGIILVALSIRSELKKNK